MFIGFTDLEKAYEVAAYSCFPVCCFGWGVGGCAGLF
jgi:hypothetical protein